MGGFFAPPTTQPAANAPVNQAAAPAAPAAPTMTAAAPAFVPAFLADVYAVSPYGDFALMNKLYYATGATASFLAARYGALPLQLPSTPECPAPQRWAVVEVPAGSALLPPAGARQSDPNKIMLAMDLTPIRQWALKFANGLVVNAGELADYYVRDPEDKFPGLADRYCRLLLAGDGVQI